MLKTKLKKIIQKEFNNGKYSVLAEFEIPEPFPKGFLTQRATTIYSQIMSGCDISVESVLEQNTLFEEKSYILHITSYNSWLNFVLERSTELTFVEN